MPQKFLPSFAFSLSLATVAVIMGLLTVPHTAQASRGETPPAMPPVSMPNSTFTHPSASPSPTPSASSGAAEPGNTISTSVPAVTKSPYDLQPPVFGPYTIHAGIKSQNSAGRGEELNSVSGRRYKLKNEYFVGATHSNGWGAAAMAVTTGSTYADGSRNKFGDGDPSLTIVHPSFYKDTNFNIWGQFRRYFALSPRSRDVNQQQYAYYLISSFNMPRGMSLLNTATPRYFQQDFYKPTDTTIYADDLTTLTKKVNSWFKYGVGQHAQVEWHSQTAPGRVIEVYPLANFTVTSNIFIEPRFYFPIYSVNSVFDAPKAVAMSQTQAEVYMQISM